jgi:small subunit ribosomal protein S16
MAVTIRLARTGRRNAPYYRIVVADQRLKRDGRFIETVGNYDPRKDATAFAVKAERVKYWLDKGARPSPTVARLLKRASKAPAAAAK